MILIGLINIILHMVENKTSKVSVLMSTYNGEKFLKEQLLSIFSQKDVALNVIVRDDGSNDGTIDILNKYQNEGRLKYYVGENLKPARSFLHLLSNAEDTDYYAFSDQDDYWLPDKIRAAVEALDAFSCEPALYFCQTQLVDASLNSIKTPKIRPLLTFGESLVCQFVGGCTMVLNKKMRKMINLYTPSYLPMHDAWIYVVAMAIRAKVVFDSSSHILYRQHGGNVIGQGQGRISEWKNRITRIRERNHTRYRLALELKKGYGTYIDEDNRAIIDKIIKAHDSFFKRCSLLCDTNYRCFNTRAYRHFQAAVIFNLF